MAQPQGFEDKVAFVWKVADKLRGHFNLDPPNGFFAAFDRRQ